MRYLTIESCRRYIGRQLNKGEALHDLRKFLRFANEGVIRKSSLDEHTQQANCLTLLTNAVIVWNTRYITAIIDQLRTEGFPVYDEDIALVSPCRYRHINKLGRYQFNIEEGLTRTDLRPLRTP